MLQVIEMFTFLIAWAVNQHEKTVSNLLVMTLDMLSYAKRYCQ